MLHLSLLREYIGHEFSPDRIGKMPFPYDLESVIDDWILLGFLVGNDFIPHLPGLHINKGALHDLYSTYKSVLPSLDGYLNENGHLNLARFERFLSRLSEKEMERFDDVYSDAKWIEGKTAHAASGAGGGAGRGRGGRGRGGRHAIRDTPGPASVFEMLEGGGGASAGISGSGVTEKRKRMDSELRKLIESADEFLDDEAETVVETTEEDEDGEATTEEATTEDENTTLDSSFSDDRDNNYHMEFRQHKREYYINKMGYSKVSLKRKVPME